MGQKRKRIFKSLTIVIVNLNSTQHFIYEKNDKHKDYFTKLLILLTELWNKNAEDADKLY
jgi:hypothetical protein